MNYKVSGKNVREIVCFDTCQQRYFFTCFFSFFQYGDSLIFEALPRKI